MDDQIKRKKESRMIKTSAVGRLTKSSELRVTSTGKAQTTFIQCVIWGKPAEVLAKYTQKGSLIAVNGELQSRSYDDQQGQTHYVTELVVAGFEFLESKETVQNREQKQQMPEMANAEPFYGMDDMEPPAYH